MEAQDKARESFLRRVSQALGRPSPGEAPALARDAEPVAERAESAMQRAEANADELMASLLGSAAEAGWQVAQVATVAEAGEYVVDLVRRLEARSVVRSGHAVVDDLRLENLLEATGVDIGLMAVDEGLDEAGREEMRRQLRDTASDADLGVTGVDFAIAETGTAVLLARKGVSRLVSLLPPVHVAVVQKGQVLADLDELFAIQGRDAAAGDLAGYASFITGPSRSADIEHTLVTGVHGPGEVHMVVVG